jgi:hypothetical protein
MNRELLRWVLVFFLVWVMIFVWESRAAEPAHDHTGATERVRG